MSSQYRGTWRIIEMEQWDQDFIDRIVSGYIAFREDQTGEFQFGAVHGYLAYRIEPYHNRARLECSWEGTGEMDPVGGHGWAMIKEGQLQGRIYFHEGDDSCFVAAKEAGIDLPAHAKIMPVSVKSSAASPRVGVFPREPATVHPLL